MIVSKLIGGLGNQMFQYAAGKSLALKRNVDVKVDVTELHENAGNKFTQRKFELDVFNSNIQIASAHEADISKFKKLNKVSESIQKIFPFLFSSLYFVERGSQFNLDFFNSPKQCYLNGFWQSQLYFIDFEKEIRKDFTFNESIIQLNELYSEKINAVNSVSIHVRRGDYVSSSEANKFHGLCSLDYYNSAVNFMRDKQSQIELFIFSDDIDWCKQNFKYDVPINFIETNNAHHDLYLMTQCKHNIIANSSFSWWGAWLNNNAKKLIIAPKQWFVDTSVNTKNIIPESWIKI